MCQRRSNLFLLLFSFLVVINCSFVYADSTVVRGQLMGAKMSEHPEWFKDSFLEIAEDVQEANEHNRHVMLYFETDGCPYCYKTIEEHFKQSPSREYIQQNFDVIALNVSGDREVELNVANSAAEKTIARLLGVVYSPTMVFLNRDNQVVLKLAGYRNRQDFNIALEYVQTGAYRDQTLADYSNKQQRDQAYKFRPHSQIKNISDLSTVAHNPLAIIFESLDCADCNALHDGHLANPGIQKALKAFTVVRYDALADTPVTDPQGKTTTARKFAATLGISYRPSIVLMDRGREIMRIENLLYHFHFAGVLEYVGARQYENYPDVVWDYVDAKTERLLAAGQNVSLSDE